MPSKRSPAPTRSGMLPQLALSAHTRVLPRRNDPCLTFLLLVLCRYAYLRERRRAVKNKCATDPMFEDLNNAYERCLVFMHKMPRMWIDYLTLLVQQCKVTRTRHTFDRALRVCARVLSVPCAGVAANTNSRLHLCTVVGVKCLILCTCAELCFVFTWRTRHACMCATPTESVRTHTRVPETYGIFRAGTAAITTRIGCMRVHVCPIPLYVWCTTWTGTADHAAPPDLAAVSQVCWAAQHPRDGRPRVAAVPAVGERRDGGLYRLPQARGPHR